MFVKFVFLVVLAVWCFSGFLLAFYLLSAGEYQVAEIGKVRQYRDDSIFTEASLSADDLDHFW